jgi:hypothetical protein
MQLKTRNINVTVAAIIAWFQEVDIRETTYRSVDGAVVTFLVLPTTIRHLVEDLFQGCVGFK